MGGWITSAAAAQVALDILRHVRPDGDDARRPRHQFAPPRGPGSSLPDRRERTAACAPGRPRGPGAEWCASRSRPWPRSSDETSTQSGRNSAICWRSTLHAPRRLLHREDQRSDSWWRSSAPSSGSPADDAALRGRRTPGGRARSGCCAWRRRAAERTMRWPSAECAWVSSRPALRPAAPALLRRRALRVPAAGPGNPRRPARFPSAPPPWPARRP